MRIPPAVHPERAAIRRRRLVAGAIAVLAGVALVGGVAMRPGAASATSVTPVAPAAWFSSLLYDTDANVTVLTTGINSDGSTIGPALTPDRGGVRQEPSGTNMMGENARDNDARIAKINAKRLLGKTPGQMVNVIKEAVNGPCTLTVAGVIHDFGCRSHKVAIDEVSPAFANPRTGGDGYLGRNFSIAMRALARTSSPWGGTYASRVAVYVDAGVTVSISAGRGKNHNLNGHGRPQYAVFSDVMPGLAKAGAVWME